MTEHKNYAEVNTSYTVFFLLSSMGLGLFFGSLITETSYSSAIIIILYVLLLYFIWDLIKQLYSPGQAVFLYATIFIVMPAAMNLLLNFPYARLGTIVLLGSYFTAGILELLFEMIVKKRLSKNLFVRIVSVDNKIDKSIIKISNEQVYLTEYRGFVFAICLTAAYFTIAYILFHI
ncbi:hypothetical protein IPL85_00325 [Candidatus Saccharibacteria bacterium]|nr:MAG: hypothetical protein IPL85_00325 [Candidatus Saccharibacteria bacterium]